MTWHWKQQTGDGVFLDNKQFMNRHES